MAGSKKRKQKPTPLNSDEITLRSYYRGELQKGIKLETFVRTQDSLLNLLREIAEIQDDTIVIDARVSNVKTGSLDLLTTITIGASSLAAADPKAAFALVWSMFKELIGLRKFLDGKPASEIAQTANGEVEVTNHSGQVQVIAGNTFNFHNNGSVNLSFRRFGTAMKMDGEIDALEFSSPSDPNLTMPINKADFDAISRDSPQLKSTVDETIEETVTLYIKRPDVLPDEKSEWEFVDVRDRSVRAAVLDQKFLEEVRRRKIQFTNGDKIFARVNTHFRTDLRNETRTILRNEIVEVTRYVPWTERTGLDFT